MSNLDESDRSGHRLRRAQATLWTGARYRGFLSVLEQGLSGFPEDARDRSAQVFGIGLLTRGQAGGRRTVLIASPPATASSIAPASARPS